MEKSEQELQAEQQEQEKLLQGKLESLKEGQQFEHDGSTYIKPEVVAPCEKHDYAYVGEEGGFRCVKCNNCISGRILTNNEYLEDGSIFSKE
jgi:hypothetical protein